MFKCPHSVGGAREYPRAFITVVAAVIKFTCLLLVILQGGVLASVLWSFPDLSSISICISQDRPICIISSPSRCQARAYTCNTGIYMIDDVCTRARLPLWSQSWESHLPFSWAHLTRMDIVTKADEVWPSFPCHTFTWVERTNETNVDTTDYRERERDWSCVGQATNRNRTNEKEKRRAREREKRRRIYWTFHSRSASSLFTTIRTFVATYTYRKQSPCTTQVEAISTLKNSMFRQVLAR